MSEKARGYIHVHVLEGRNLKRAKTGILSVLRETYYDIWVEVILEKVVILSTKVYDNDPNPLFFTKASVPFCYKDDTILVKVYDRNLLTSHVIGTIKLKIPSFYSTWKIKDWFPLDTKEGEIFIDIQFDPYIGPLEVINSEPLGLTSYFQKRKGGTLKLYQDADILSSTNYPEIPECLIGGSCFSEIFNALENASKFIYIVGWSLWTNLMLVRNGDDKLSLGELLKKKANEDVTVLILIWSDKLSSKLCRELFGTHYRQTVKFFEDTNVICRATMREPVDGRSLNQLVDESIYTHHMKFFVCDDIHNSLVGFLGGLDLTDGRWDSPDHSLWETLDGVHKNDFYNGFIPASMKTGPREPWHDCHAKITGPSAIDLVTAFEERWKRHVPKMTSKLFDLSTLLLKEEQISDKDITWNMQILRTSDTDSTVFSQNVDVLYELRGIKVDNSICKGYVNLIRSTTKFLYIESQYFLGSSFDWAKTTYSESAQNTIPAEIAEQICYSIRDRTPIRVYVVIPMAPEGDPETTVGCASMTDILLWQFQTIQMMYRRIYRTISEVGINAHPEDFLLFLCPAKKHSKENFAGRLSTGMVNEMDLWQRRRRFLIYVHSKMMLADDARIIVGSANLNQRSLDGRRDTEIAVAGSQSRGEDIVTDGEVSRFRKSLWYEHTLGESESNAVYKDPSSYVCLKHIRQRSEEALAQYMDDSFEDDVDYRFLKYPLKITEKGECSSYPEIPNIPDFDIPVTGKKSYIPAIITT